MSKQAWLTEFVDSRGVALRVDREKGVIHGVKVLGYQSKNGRRYTEAAVDRARSLYEGAKVNVNHPDGSPDTPRDYRDRLGQLTHVEHRKGDGLYADLHYNPRHALAEQLAWDAEHSPENVGLSHNVIASSASKGGEIVIEEIKRVKSVDLVADPATTSGLYEHDEGEKPVSLTLEAVKADASIMECLRRDILAEQANSESAKQQAEEIKALREQLDGYKAAEKLAARKAKVEAAIAEAKLPKELVTDLFVTTCLEAADDRMAALIAERKALAGKVPAASIRPVSREQSTTEGLAAQGGSFVSRLRMPA